MAIEVFWIPPALAGLYLWWRMVRNLRPEREEVVKSSLFRVGDGIFAIILASYFLLGILGGDSGTRVVTTEVVASGLVLYLVMTLFVFTFLRLRGLDVVSLFGLNRMGWKTVVLPAVVGIVAIYPAVVVVAWVAKLVLGPEAGSDATIAFLRSNPGPGALLLTGLLVVVVAPFVEEFLFRGVLYGVARKFGGRYPAMIATSLLFTAIHLSPLVLAPLFVLSLALTLSYERTGSLWTPILMHMIFNGGQFAILLLFPEWIT